MKSNYIYIFGYGSLISHRGINHRGLSKIYTRDDLHIARLNNYSREWNTLWNNNRYLGLKENIGSVINGVIFKLHNKDINHFLESENSNDKNTSKNLYTMVDVTNNIIWKDKILLDHPEDRVFTLVTVNPTTNGNIPNYYLSYINDYFKEYNKDFVSEFWTTTTLAKKQYT